MHRHLLNSKKRFLYHVERERERAGSRGYEAKGEGEKRRRRIPLGEKVCITSGRRKSGFCTGRHSVVYTATRRITFPPRRKKHQFPQSYANALGEPDKRWPPESSADRSPALRVQCTPPQQQVSFTLHGSKLHMPAARSNGAANKNPLRKSLQHAPDFPGTRIRKFSSNL